MRLLTRLPIGLALVGFLALLTVSGCPRGPQYKRIVILINGNSPYWDACRAGLTEAEKSLDLKKDGYTAVFVDNDGSPQGQIDKLRQFASQSDVVAVGLVPVDAGNASIVDEMRALKKKGIHVITIDSDVDREKFREARFAYVGTDNSAGGVELGKCIKGLKPTEARYVTFVGRTGAQNAIDRIGGVAKGAGENAKSLDSMADENDRSRAKENVRNAITNHMDKGLNALVGIWSYNAPAIVDVVKEKSMRDKFAIVVFDAEPLTIEALGDGMVDAMVVQNPFEMGFQGVRLMKALIKDDKATINEMLPRLKEKDGDIFDTGLRVVVPDKGSSLKADMFDKSTKFMNLSTFREWLAKYNLKQS